MKQRLRYVRKIKTENLIRSYFERSETKVYTPQQLATLLERNRNTWGLAATTPVKNLITRLVDNNIIRLISFDFEAPHPATPPKKGMIEIPDVAGAGYERYLYGEPSIFEIACSIHSKAYLSHYTAVYLQGLTNQIPKTLYITQEQSFKLKKSYTPLTQENIDYAFSRPQRRSETVAIYEDYTFVMLKGMFTNRQGVYSPSGQYAYTNLERTLIDIAVRPNYAGGAFMVLEAYKRAITQEISINKLVATLSKLSFLYPYHQAVGFYLEKAGYQGKQLELLRKSKMEFNFYLDYNMEETDYSPNWKLYYPKGM